MKSKNIPQMTLVLDNTNVTYGGTLTGHATVKYGDFKNGDIRLKI